MSKARSRESKDKKEGSKVPVDAKKDWELTHDQITLDKKLGEGAFGEVHSGKLKLKNKRTVDVAVKVAKCDENKEKLKELMREAKLMRKYDHPNVVKLYGVAVDQDPLMLVMELVDGGALDSYLQKNASTVRLQEKLDYMCCGAAWGLEYLHSKLCIHRDVAARNCLYAKNTVKISDFGLSQEGETYQMTTAKRLPIKWLSPETLTTGLYTAKSDVFSFGVMVWEIFANGQEPYVGMNNAEVQAKVLEGFRMEMAPDAPETVVELINKHCWDANPDTRWAMAQIAREFETITGCKPPEQKTTKKKRGGTGMTTEASTDQTVGTVEERTVEKNEKTVDKDEKTVEKETPKETKKEKEPAKPRKKNTKEVKETKPRVAGSKKKTVASRKKKTKG